MNVNDKFLRHVERLKLAELPQGWQSMSLQNKFSLAGDVRATLQERAATGCKVSARVLCANRTESYRPHDEVLEPVVYDCQPEITCANLIYHVCPLQANDIWVKNVHQLRQRLKIFNGRRIVAVAQGTGLKSLSIVARELGVGNIDYFPVKNDPVLREVASFELLLRKIESVNLGEVTFYAHTKGNSTDQDVLGVEFWRNAMYHHLLDGYLACWDLLTQHPCVGTHKMLWSSGCPYPSGLMRGNWMYAGTFFWFRHKDVFSRSCYPVPRDRYGAEAWLSGFVKPNEAATVYQPWPTHWPLPSPYRADVYQFPLRDPQ